MNNKNILLRSLFFVFFILTPLLGAFAQKDSKGSKVGIIIQEDFSKFEKGTESSPDGKDCADSYTTEISSSLTQKEGWTGAAVHQAGGTCFISSYSTGWDFQDGYINTPLADHSGEISFSFRAKKKGSGTSKINLNVVYRSKSLAGFTGEINEEWKEFQGTLSVDASEYSIASFIQFSSEYNVKFYIDDIKVERKASSLPIPSIADFTEVNANGFTANWKAIDGISDYLLSVYAKKSLQEKDSIVNNFDKITITEDKKLTNNDFGAFIVDLSSGNGPQVGQEKDVVQSGNQALFFNADKDYLETKDNKKAIRHCSFWAKAEKSNQKSKLLIEEKIEDKWVPSLEIDTKVLKEGKFISLSDKMNYNTTAIRLSYKEEGGGMYLDDFRVYFEADPLYVEGYKDLLVQGTSKKVEGLDPEVDYFYSVKSSSEGKTSLPSEEIFVYSLLSPKALDGKEIEHNSFVAQWEKTPKAKGYILYNYNEINALDNKEYSIISETFDKVKVEASPEKAQAGKKENGFLDAYTQSPGWMGSHLIFAKGMIGTKGFGAEIYISTLKFDIPKDAERNFSVHIKVWAEKGTDLSMKVNGKRPKDLELINFKETGFIEKDIQFPYKVKEDLNISFLTFSGEPFLLDNVDVKINLLKGDKVQKLNNRIYIKEQKCNFKIENLVYTENTNYLYKLQAYRSIGKNMIFSDFSNNIRVTLKKKSGNKDIRRTSLKVYPNPADEKVTIENLLPMERLRVYSLDGVLIARARANQRGYAQINVVHLPNGLYIIQGDNKSFKLKVLH